MTATTATRRRRIRAYLNIAHLTYTGKWEPPSQCFLVSPQGPRQPWHPLRDRRSRGTRVCLGGVTAVTAVPRSSASASAMAGKALCSVDSLLNRLLRRPVMFGLASGGAEESAP